MNWLLPACATRKNVFRATTRLATKVQKWNRSFDTNIQHNMLTGSINDPQKNPFLEMFVDANSCGRHDDCHSTNGDCIQLSGPSTQFPHAWLSDVPHFTSKWLRATTPSTFPTSYLPKVPRDPQFLTYFTSKCASGHNGVHFSNILTSKKKCTETLSF